MTHLTPLASPGVGTSANTTLGGVGLQQMDLGGTQFSPLHTAVGNFCKDSRRQGPGVEAFLSAPRTVGQSEMHRGGV